MIKYDHISYVMGIAFIQQIWVGELFMFTYMLLRNLNFILKSKGSYWRLLSKGVIWKIKTQTRISISNKAKWAPTDNK